MSAITIGSITIRQDDEGRYCLNDLYQASGGANRHRPSLWFRSDRAKALIRALDAEENKARIRAYSSTQKSGAFVVKELVYAYATWVSPDFELRVYRAYDALVTGEYVKPLTQSEKYWFARRPHWPQIRALALAGKIYREIAAEVGRSIASVRNALRRMVEVGLLDPAKLALAQRGVSRLSALRRCIGWGAPPGQLALDFA